MVQLGIRDRYREYKQEHVREKDVFPKVKIISYHIPKTAGTSLYASLEEAYGPRKIRREYDEAGSLCMSRGQPYWVGNNIRVIHGHFRPHFNHNTRFPNAMKVMWVRDPMERCWSLLRHWVKLRQGKFFTMFSEKYMQDENWELTELFDKLVRDPQFKKIISVFQTFTQNIDRKDIDFFGRSEAYNEELKRLSEMTGTPLIPFSENVNPDNKKLPFSRKDYFPFFEEEYIYLRDWIGVEYPLNLD